MLKLAVFGLLVGLAFYGLRVYIKGTNCNLTDRIDNRIVLVTGANTGIGLETAKELAKRGAHVVMTCRDQGKCYKAEAAVKQASNSKNVHCMVLDLGSFKSIRAFLEKFKKNYQQLHVTILNAGVMACPYSETEQGFEMQIGVNHIGHFLLTRELLPQIKAAASVDARIIVVSSSASLHGKINTTDLNLRGEDYGPFAAYHQSKLANVLFAAELSRRLADDRVTAVSLHPGVIDTELARHLPPYMKFIMQALGSKLLMKTPLEGAQTQICAAVNPQLARLNGQYLANCAPETPNPDIHDKELAAKLWEMTEELIAKHW